MVYTIAKIKNASSNIENVTIKYIAKKVIATNIGEHKTFCNTIANNIVATGNAKNNNKIFILISFLSKGTN